MKHYLKELKHEAPTIAAFLFAVFVILNAPTLSKYFALIMLDILYWYYHNNMFIILYNESNED